MKLIDLLEAIGEGYCSFDTAEIIQIYEPNMDWDNFSEFHVGSQLLKPFVDFEVDCIGAIAENVIRVALYNEDFCGVKGYFPMPCKVGDTVYEILEETVPERYFYISEYEVQDVSTRGIKYADDWNLCDNGNLLFTKREAEAELERRKERQKNE